MEASLNSNNDEEQGTPNFFKIARYGKNSWWRFLLTASFAGIGKILSDKLARVIFTFYVNNDRDPNTSVSPEGDIVGLNSWPALILNNFEFIGFFIFLWVAMRLFHHRPFRTLVSADEKFSWRQLAHGFLIYGSVYGFAHVILSLTGLVSLEFKLDKTFWWTNFLLALVIVSFQSFMEEVFFRGYLFQQLNLVLKRPIIPAVIVGVAFSLVHIDDFKNFYEFLTVIPIFFIFNFIFFFAVAFTDSVALASGLHAANNYIGLFIIEKGDSLAFPIYFLVKKDLIGFYEPYTYLIPAFILLMAFYGKKNWKRLFEKS